MCPQGLASCNSTVAGSACLLKGGQHLARNALIALYVIPAACMPSGRTIRILCTKCHSEAYSSKYNTMCDRCGDESRRFLSSTSYYSRGNSRNDDCSKCKKRYSPDKYYNVCNSCGDQDKKEEEERKKREELRRKEEELKRREKEVLERERELRKQEEQLWKREADKKRKPAWKQYVC